MCLSLGLGLLGLRVHVRGRLGVLLHACLQLLNLEVHLRQVLWRDLQTMGANHAVT
jgi:hypothetical protein